MRDQPQSPPEPWETWLMECRGTDIARMVVAIARHGLKHGSVAGDDLAAVLVDQHNSRGAAFKTAAGLGLIFKDGPPRRSRIPLAKGHWLSVWTVDPVLARAMLDAYESAVLGPGGRAGHQMELPL